MDLSAQEVNLFVPHILRCPECTPVAECDAISDQTMDLWIVAAIVMLVAWGALTFMTEAPGYVHLLLTFGVFIVIWRMVVNKTPDGPRSKS